jgi:hypothetical protein
LSKNIYKLRASLRKRALCSENAGIYADCKQKDTLAIDSWVLKYKDRSINKYFIEYDSEDNNLTQYNMTH